jgi:hypothetical protein
MKHATFLLLTPSGARAKMWNVKCDTLPTYRKKEANGIHIIARPRYPSSCLYRIGSRVISGLPLQLYGIVLANLQTLLVPASDPFESPELLAGRRGTRRRANSLHTVIKAGKMNINYVQTSHLRYCLRFWVISRLNLLVYSWCYASWLPRWSSGASASRRCRASSLFKLAIWLRSAEI